MEQRCPSEFWLHHLHRVPSLLLVPSDASAVPAHALSAAVVEVHELVELCVEVLQAQLDAVRQQDQLPDWLLWPIVLIALPHAKQLTPIVLMGLPPVELKPIVLTGLPPVEQLRLMGLLPAKQLGQIVLMGLPPAVQLCSLERLSHYAASSVHPHWGVVAARVKRALQYCLTLGVLGQAAVVAHSMQVAETVLVPPVRPVPWCWKEQWCCWRAVTQLP